MTKMTRAPCRRRIGGAVPRAENFGDLITADHKVLSDNCESRNNHRYAVVVQDPATQWIQSYPCKTKSSQETQRSFQKFLVLMLGGSDHMEDDDQDGGDEENGQNVETLEGEEDVNERRDNERSDTW